MSIATFLHVHIDQKIANFHTGTPLQVAAMFLKCSKTGQAALFLPQFLGAQGPPHFVCIKIDDPLSVAVNIVASCSNAAFESSRHRYVCN
jgi:hypothetical protein